MEKTLFKKYLQLTSMTILISFLMLGLVMLVFIKSYWQDEKQTLLSKNAESVAQIASKSIIDKGHQPYQIDVKVMKTFMSAFASNIDADIFVTDTRGDFIISAVNNGSNLIANSVDPDIMKKVLAGQYQSQGIMGGMYSQPYYMVGVPVYVMDANGQESVIGAVFTACNARSFNNYREELIRIFFWAALATFMVSFCIVWLFSYNLARPLRNMALAAHSFGKGNFAIRVPVTSQDEIGQLAIAFNKMATSLASGESVRRNFIANVSHELKTPMTTIAGFIDGILDGTIAPEKQQDYLRIVSREIKRLSRLVRTMLDLSRIDGDELHLCSARFDLTNTIFVALLSFEKSIEQKEIQIRGLENAESLYVDGDPDMIHQVVYNLIENAVKFTNVGGYIELRLTGEPDRTLVSIKNSGAGIPAEEAALIFDRFYKTDKSRSHDKNGMGLGLYIVRTIIKLHGGEITVSSVENEYCQFAFWLPKLRQPKIKEGKKETSQKAQNKSNGGEHHER